MIVSVVDPQTGCPMEMECNAQSENDIAGLLAHYLSEVELRKKIGSLEISADAKSILFQVSRATIQVGKSVVRIGRKIIEIILKILSEFPLTSAGAIFGYIFGLLVTTIPIVGVILGPIVTPLSVAFGLAAGAINDFGNKALERRILASMAAFESLKPKV